MCFCKDAFPVICVFVETKSRRRVICHCTGTRKKLRWMGKLKISGGSGVENAEEIFPGSRCHYLKTGETPFGWWFFTTTQENRETRSSQRIKERWNWTSRFLMPYSFKVEVVSTAFVHDFECSPRKFGGHNPIWYKPPMFFIFVQLADHGSHQKTVISNI